MLKEDQKHKLFPLCVKDIPQYSQLHQLCFEGGLGWKEKEFHGMMNTPTNMGFSLKHNKKTVGLIIVSVVLDEAEILTLAVHPDHRRQGLAYDLWQETKTFLQNQNATLVFLEVSENNKPAQQAYIKWGFKQYGKRKDYYHYKNAQGQAVTQNALLYQVTL